MTVDNRLPSAYNASNQGKPMSKRSNRSGHLSESRGWWDHGSELSGEWTCEGRANGAAPSVASDGTRTRYPGGTYEVRETSGRFASTWVVPQDGFRSCPKSGTGLFCLSLRWFRALWPLERRIVHEALYETMAEPEKFFQLLIFDF